MGAAARALELERDDLSLLRGSGQSTGLVPV